MHEIDRTGAGGALSPEVRSLVATIVNGVLALAGASRYSNEGSNPFGVAIKTKGCQNGSLCLAPYFFIIQYLRVRILLLYDCLVSPTFIFIVVPFFLTSDFTL
jgi:hypothetical protein